ncbi:hypothetical protein A5821_001948 [Enterococcus sp. 7F3_DIV0205]|uniref:Uncharacterized protein n=1 Tax=Candidatus Enterococcus palustris TaxID=1834189 RepID=A0AAQ3Y6A0_9ENTE|nr:hypothetical protein [Enterococcus sp. 7F3_DIV0205]OTN82384.1 hypothetical protein A5821_002295 [Enterococcus sp. 7F3_DIV0205]
MTNKKILIRIGVGLTVIGLIIALAGFTMAGFQLDKYREEGTISWYRTIRFD